MKTLMIALTFAVTTFFSHQAGANMVLVNDAGDSVVINGEYVQLAETTCKQVFVKGRVTGYKCTKGQYMYIQRTMDGKSYTIAAYDAATDEPTYMDVFTAK